MKKITILSICASAYLFAGGALAPVLDYSSPYNDELPGDVVESVVQNLDSTINIPRNSIQRVEVNPFPVIENAKLKSGAYCVDCEEDNVYGRVSVLGMTSSHTPNSINFIEEGVDNDKSNKDITDDAMPKDLFKKETSALDIGIEIGAEEHLGRFFAGAEVNGIISSRSLTDVRDIHGDGSENKTSAAITELYVGANVTNGTEIKVGRMSLNTPLAFSEKWSVADNTFEAVTIHTDVIPKTAVKVGYIRGYNKLENLSQFYRENTSKGTYFVSAKVNPISSLELEGSYYVLRETPSKETGNKGYLKAEYNGLVSVAGQAGYIYGDRYRDDTKAFGLEVSSNIGAVNVRGAVSTVDGSESFKNVSGTKTPLFTQMEFNDNAIAHKNTTYLLEVSKDAFSIGYGLTVDDSSKSNDFKELDVSYGKSFGDIGVVATYSNINSDTTDKMNHKIRAVVRYNF